MATLSGKKALVLGGSRGIGAAIVERLAKEGANTTFTYGSSADAANELAQKTGATTLQADSGKREEVSQLIAEQGPLDILVVNAGIAAFGDPFELDPDEVDRMIDINVRGPYYASVEAARKMPDGGRIVIIGSASGDRTPFAGGSAYSMTKSAMQGMVRGLARDFGEKGITINNIQPGPVDTDLNPEDGPTTDTQYSFMAIKRYGRPHEIAGMVAYLVGPEASIVTGAQHTVDGGYSA